MDNVKIVSIEGNIGSGKSSLLANLKTYLGNEHIVIFLKEPVDEWSNIKDKDGVTILEKFYSNQTKYSFSFQMMAYISRLKILKDTINQIQSTHNELIRNRFTKLYINYDEQENYTDLNLPLPKYIIITERCLYTDKLVFAKMLYDSGNIEDINYQIYLNWFDTFAQDFPINKVIYVKTDPEICHKRISKRNRDGENNISLEYLKLCNEYHNNMLDNNTVDCICKDQLVLNGNNDIYENETILHEWIQSIESFIITPTEKKNETKTY